jgi:enhancing lycopene biosynthesis protein 2
MFLFACFEASGASPVSRCAGIARAFGFPEKWLVEKNVTLELQRKRGANVIAAWQYISTNGSLFAPLSIVVANAGTFVNAEMHEEVSAYWEKEGGTGGVSRIAAGDQADGYAFSTAGPGGSCTRIVLRFPARGVDVQMILNVPGDPPLDSTAETEEYHRIITSGGQAIKKKLTECASQAAKTCNVMDTVSNTADQVNQSAASAERSEREWRVATPVVVAAILAVVLLSYACIRRRGGRQRPH